MQSLTSCARWALGALSATLVAFALPATAPLASASDARVVVAGVAPLASHDVVVQRVITASFDLALAQPRQRELTAFIASLSDPASANYHRFLTTTEYARRFGASASSVSAVRTYLRRYGLDVGTLSKGRNILSARGTTSDIARAFDATVQTVRRGDGELVARFATPATVPATLAEDVTAVAGLSSVQPATTSDVVAHAVAAPTSCASAGSSTGTTPNYLGGYTALQQAQLYGLNTAWQAGDTGVGQTIAVYELATYDPSDVATYFACYGVDPNITTINVDGGPNALDNNGNAPDEATLDVEEAQVLAPGANIEVYQGTNAGNGTVDIYSQIASDNTASIVTTSWGVCEPQTSGTAQAEQTIFEEMAAQGQTVIAASGDSGSSDCAGSTSGSSTALAVDDPASQPLVTGVGGLSVTNTDPLNQSVWNDNCSQSSCGASGGGVSTIWSQPSWQVAPGITTSASTGGMRMVPDLSVMGSPSTGFIQYYTGTSFGPCQVNCSGGWGGIGGTSIGAPLVSALVAVAAQACGSRLGTINPSLYAMATTGFNDVTTGSNDLYGVGEYSAGVGYDMASGLGSPNGAAFLSGLCPNSISTSASTFSVSPEALKAPGAPATISVALRDAANLPVTNATLTVNASAPAGLVTIDGDPSSSSGSGSASYSVTSDVTGLANFTVASSIAQDVRVDVTYQGNTIYSTTLTFKASKLKPSAPTISSLVPLVGGFSLRLKPSTNNVIVHVTRYQYSINRGATWVSLASGATAVNVTKLKRGALYVVIARALSADGPSTSSPAKRVVTRS